MRGMPNNPVTCEKCGGPDGFPNVRRCRRCMPPTARKKYFWTPDLNERLRRIYAEHAHSREALGEGITALAKLMRCPRYIVSNRAGELRIRTSRGKTWTKEEVEFLRKSAGVRSIEFMMKTLKRGQVALLSKLWELRLSWRVTEGYSRQDLTAVFCVSFYTVGKWIDRGWLRPLPSTDRIPEEQVLRFIKNHPEEYSLKRVDEAWFKGMIFPSFGSLGKPCDRRDSDSHHEEVA
jgi:hypothetical protein